MLVPKQSENSRINGDRSGKATLRTNLQRKVIQYFSKNNETSVSWLGVTTQLCRVWSFPENEMNHFKKLKLFMEIIYLFKYVMPRKRLGRRILKLLSSAGFGFVKAIKIWDTSPFCVSCLLAPASGFFSVIQSSASSQRSFAASPRLFYPPHPSRVLFYSCSVLFWVY